jgi:hypothetical protein
MSGQKSKENVFTPSNTAVVTSAASLYAIQSRRYITQNFLIIWMGANIDQSDKEC